MNQSNSVLIILLCLTFICFCMLFLYGKPEYMYRSNGSEPTLSTFTFPKPLPVYVTDSNVRILNSYHAIERPKIVFSPTHTITTESNYSDIPIVDKEDFLNAQEKSYKFEVGDRNFKSIGEKLCCKILEEYLQRETIVNSRPNFMKNPATKRNLELDVYDPVTKIAIEYNGSQHYCEVDFFNVDTECLNKQQERDKLKIELCQKNNIKLIVVPYTIDSGYKDVNGKWHYINRDIIIRELKLKAFLIPLLIELTES